MFSAQNTGVVVVFIAYALFGKGDPATLALVHYYVRKSAHFLDYALLSGLWFFALQGSAPRWKARWAALALCIALLVAAADELHQSLLPSRTGSVWDVVLDMQGALAAQVVVGLYLALKRRAVPAQAD